MLHIQAEKLLTLFNKGYTIEYVSRYVDGSMRLYKEEDGRISGNSQVWAFEDITEQCATDFSVSKVISNWEEE